MWTKATATLPSLPTVFTRSAAGSLSESDDFFQPLEALAPKEGKFSVCMSPNPSLQAESTGKKGQIWSCEVLCMVVRAHTRLHMGPMVLVKYLWVLAAVQSGGCGKVRRILLDSNQGHALTQAFSSTSCCTRASTSFAALQKCVRVAWPSVSHPCPSQEYFLKTTPVEETPDLVNLSVAPPPPYRRSLSRSWQKQKRLSEKSSA